MNRMSVQKTRAVAVLGPVVAALALGPVVEAAGPRRGDPRGGEIVPSILAVHVTDADPRAAFGTDRTAHTGVLKTGPFDAHETASVHVLTVLDRRTVGTEPLDQVTTFVLPDGSRYQEVTTPLDPRGSAGATVQRTDLGPSPVALEPLPRLRRLARMMPGVELPPRLARQSVFTTVTIPVSGTWITKHNLYGEWVVEIALERDGRVLANTSATFEIETLSR